MSKTKVAIVSKTEPENYILQRKLEILDREYRGLAFPGYHPSGIAASVDANTAIILLNLTDWTPIETQLLYDLSDVGYRGPLIVISKDKTVEALKDISMASKIVHLSKPVDVGNLLGIVRKMLSARAVLQQVHRRYTTSQNAEIELLGQAEKFASQVKNLSKGGALLEVAQPAPLKVGQIVRLKMELKDLNRTYTMSAKVVWAQATVPKTGGGVGVEFVSGDMKKVILGY